MGKNRIASMDASLKPVLKWVGGKRQLLDENFSPQTRYSDAGSRA